MDDYNKMTKAGSMAVYIILFSNSISMMGKQNKNLVFQVSFNEYIHII